MNIQSIRKVDEIMKNHNQGRLARWVSTAAVAVTVVGSLAVFGGSTASAGIKDTKHNLGSQQAGANANEFSGTGEICVFCHTPHAADTAAQIPLWNRKASTTPLPYATYNSLGTLSLDGGTAAVGSTSMACLSCHDGTQAMNTVINAPGSGLVGDAAWVAGLSGTGWSGTNQLNGKMTGLAAVGADTQGLKNDHPVGIQYAGGPKIANTVPAAPNPYLPANFKDPDFKRAESATLGGNQVWWVETNADATRQKTDLPLYARAEQVTFTDGSTATVTNQPFVECASCHDPHSEKATFLRTENTNSAVCLACHDK